MQIRIGCAAKTSAGRSLFDGVGTSCEGAFEDTLLPLGGNLAENVRFDGPVQLLYKRPVVRRSDHGQTIEHDRVENIIAASINP